MMKKRILPAVLAAASLAAPATAQAEILELPVNTLLPSVTGTPVVGQTLGVDVGSWLYAEGGPRYQWKRCDADGQQCTAVTGATASTFLVTGDDALSTLRVTVTMSNLLGSTDADTPPSRLVEAAPASNDSDSAGTSPTPSGPTSGTHDGAKCLKVASRRRDIKVGRAGRLRITVARSRCVSASNPLRLSFRAAKGKKVRSVRYKLGASRPRTTKARGHRVTFKSSQLRAGTHRLSVRVSPRRGKAKTLTARLRLVAS